MEAPSDDLDHMLRNRLRRRDGGIRIYVVPAGAPRSLNPEE